MAEIHSAVQVLLSAVLESPMAPIVQEAITQIQIDDDRLSRTPEPTSESAVHRGQRHLQLAEAAIIERLKFELDLMKQLKQLAPDLGIASINVLPTTDEAGRTPFRARADNLLSADRRAAIEAFVTAWTKAANQVRLDLEGDTGA